jgi:hypothetical protein
MIMRPKCENESLVEPCLDAHRPLWLSRRRRNVGAVDASARLHPGSRAKLLTCSVLMVVSLLVAQWPQCLTHRFPPVRSYQLPTRA